MPRDGSNIYHTPPGTPGITNTTIASTPYNGYLADIEQDLNLPRPIVAGGTGANNARDAMTSLQGDVAYQVVTNYDSYVFVSGSFYSAAGATSAPTANAFIGQCYTSDPAVVPPAVPAGQNMFIEARDVTTGKKYIRQKIAGVWQAWTAGIALDIDAAYVNVSGDVMTGDLGITKSSPMLSLNASASSPAILQGATSNIRWRMYLGDGSTESTGDAGSNFGIFPFSDAGVQKAAAFAISRATGNAAFSGTVQVANTTASSSPSTGALTVAGGLGVGGAIYSNGGPIVCTGGSILAAATATTGSYYFGTGGTKVLSYDGINFNFVGGPLTAQSLNVGAGNIYGSTHFFGYNFATDFYATISGAVRAINFSGAGVYAMQLNNSTGLLSYLGNSATAFTSNFNGDFSITGANAFKPGGGSWVAPSDARIKNDLGDYPRGLNEIAQLRPVYYTYKGNDTPEAPAHIRQDDADNKLPLAVPYPNSMHIHAATAATKFAGLIAQEVEAIIPEMVAKRSAYIDGVAVDDLRSLDTTPLIFALINACKELKARVEALEAA